MAAVERFFGDNIRIKTYKNNSDGKGNSYGCHENFTVDRRTPFADIVRCLTPHLITRQVLCGAGKVGFESPDRFGVSEGFQVSQRADFFEAEVGLETTLKRPIINTRDEPHSDSHRYRRLHVIIGDANLSEWATFVKLGTTALVLCLIEDGEISEDFRPLDPVRTLRDVSADIDLEHSFTTRSGARLSALDIQELLCERAQKWAARSSFDAVGGDEVGTLIVAEWQQAIDDLRADPLLCADRIEWVAKRQLCERFAERHNLLAGDPRLSALGLQYHDMAPGKGIAEKLNFRRLVDSSLIEHAVDFAPSSTRAWFRGECLRRFPDQIVSANWDSLVVDAGGPKLRRIPMMEPLRGTELQTSNAFANSSSMNDVLTWLEST